jgi:hypothetical protein
MFTLFSFKRNSSLEIAKGADDLVQQMARVIKSHQSGLDALGDAHAEIDLRLVRLIDQVLEPLIGPSGIDDHAWFQSLDWYGDGVRHLEFQPGKLPLNVISSLQRLLVNEYSNFCILCWAPLERHTEKEEPDGVVIFARKLVVTSRLARLMALA